MAGGRAGTGLLTQHLTPFPACIMNYVFKTDIHASEIKLEVTTLDISSAGSRGGVEDLHIFMLHEQLTLVGKCCRTQVIRFKILILDVKVHENCY